ncbi:MAG: TolC family protein [Candidatus Parabeggiatoa sp.]|nr:TolC family protein [Candidatus Parabeggiatoa sp.]
MNNHRPPILLSLLFTILLGLNGDAQPATPPNQEVKRITLAEAVALALRYNRTVETAYLNRLIEKFDLKVAQDKFFPDLSVFSSVSQGHHEGKNALNSQVGAEAFLKIPTGGEFGLSWTQSTIDPWQAPVDSFDRDDGFGSNNGFGSDLVFSFRQPLLKGGGVDVNRASQVIAMRQEHKNLLNLKETLMTTITQVIHTYRRFLLAQRGIEINRLSLERSRHLLEVNRILIEEGRLARMEIIQAEVDLANQELSFRENENALDSTRLELLKLLDINRHTLIEPIELIQVEPINLNIETLLQIVFENQPDYLQALLSHKNAQTKLLLAKNNKLWELDVQARYNITGRSDSWIEAQENAGRLGEGDYSVELSLRIPFGDYTLPQGVVGAKVALRQSEIALQELKENIAIAIQDAVRDIKMKWEQVKLARRARELSQQQLEIELEKFKVARSSNFQIVSFQNALIRAENNEIRTKVSYLNALTDLDMLLGTTLERWKINIETVRRIGLP